MWKVVTGEMCVSGCQPQLLKGKIALHFLSEINKSKVLWREIRTVDNHPRERSSFFFARCLCLCLLPVCMKLNRQPFRGVCVWLFGNWCLSPFNHCLVQYQRWVSVCVTDTSWPERKQCFNLSSLIQWLQLLAVCCCAVSLFKFWNKLPVIIPALLNTADCFKDSVNRLLWRMELNLALG